MRVWASTPTARLAAARLEFSSDRRFTRALLAVAMAAVLLAAGAIAWQSYVEGRVSATTLRTLQQRNAALDADLAQTRTELELERSTRAALAGQVAELNAEKRELQNRLAFFSAQNGRPGNAR